MSDHRLTASPPDGGWGYAVMVSSFFVAFLSDGIGNAYGLLLPVLVDTFHTSVVMASLPPGLYMGFFLLSGPFTARLSAKLGNRLVTFLGGLITSICLVIASVSVSMPMFILFYGVLAGVGLGLIYLPSITMVNAYFERKRGVVVGVVTCGSGVGLLVMASLIEHLMTLYGWRGCYLVVAGISLHLCLCACLLRPLEPAVCQADSSKNSSCSDNYDITCDRDDNAGEQLHQQDLSAKGVPATNDSRLGDFESVTGTQMAKPSSNSKTKFHAMNATSHGIELQTIGSLGNVSEPHVEGDQPLSNGLAALEKLGLLKEPLASSIDSADSDGHLDDVKVRYRHTHEQDLNESNNGLQHYGDSPSIGEYFCYAKSEILCDPSDRDQGKYLAGAHSAAVDLPGGFVTSGKSLPDLGSPGEGGQSSRSSIPACIAMTSHSWQEPEFLSSSSKSRHHRSAASDVTSRYDDVRVYTSRHGRLPEPMTESLLRIRPGSHRPEVATSMLLLNQPVETMVGSNLSLASHGSRQSNRTTSPASICMEEVQDADGPVETPPSAPPLLRDPVFLVFCMGASLVQIANNLPNMYTPSYALSIGLTSGQAATIVSILGISNTVGRFLAGYLSYLGLGSIRVYNSGIFLAGISCLLFHFCTSFPLLIAFAVVFGFSLGSVPPLQSVILVEVLGLERLPSSFGVMCLCKSLACMTGPSLAGALYEVTRDYQTTFVFAGLLFLLAGFLHLLMAVLNRRRHGQCLGCHHGNQWRST